MLDEFDSLIKTKEGREKIADNFYNLHEDWLVEEGIKDYCQFLDELGEIMPLTRTILNNLWERVIIATSEFVKGTVTWEEFKDVIQDWSVKSYEANIILKKAKHG